MKLRGLATGIFSSLCLLALASAVGAGETGRAFEPAYGKALAPVGYIAFCAQNGKDCRPAGQVSGRPALTKSRFKLVEDVNSLVNARIAPVSDQDLYGEPEHWTYPVDAGDCEDFVLLKKRYLEEAGLPASALLITVVLDEKGAGHAVLTIAAKEGDYVLDNRRNQVLRWDRTGYTFLKRQTAEDPRRWVALTGQDSVKSGPTAVLKPGN